MQTDIVLISAKQGGGKTTLAKHIRNSIQELESDSKNWSVIECTFASPIYEMHNQCRQVLRNYGIKPPHEIKDGNLLQLLGTEWGRKTISEDIWVQCVRGRIAQDIEIHRVLGVRRLTILVPDLRFKNEFNGFPDALRIRLTASEECRRPRCEMWRENSNHQSETDLDDHETKKLFDFIYDSENIPSKSIALRVITTLLDGRWLEKRAIA